MQSLLARSGPPCLVASLILAVFTLWVGEARAGETAPKPALHSATVLEPKSVRRSPTVRFVAHRDHDEDDGHDHDDEEHEHFDEDDEEFDEHEFEEIEIERMYVEMERASIEALYGGIELVQKIAEIASNDDTIAAMAVSSVNDVFEPEDAEEFLLEVAERASSKTAQRVARLQLIELYGEQDDLKGVRKQLRALIFTDD